MTEKLRDCFDEMVVYKNLKKNNFFASLSLPAFLRDWLLKKFEDEGYIKREVNPQNRRKYMLNTTSKADELVPKIRQISQDWEAEVGITEADDELKQRIKEISINSMKLIGE